MTGLKVWCESWDERVYTDARLEPTIQLDGVPLASGEALGDRFPEGMHLILNAKHQPSDFTFAGPAFVVSGRLRRVLEAGGAQLECFHLTTEFNGREHVVERYCFANIVASADCLDWDETVCKRVRGRALDIQQLAIRADAVPVSPLFRIKGTVPSIVVASGALATAVTQSGCTGMEFQSVEKWRDPSLSGRR